MLTVTTITFAPAMIVVWWFRARTVPPRPWIAAAAVFTLGFFGFWGWNDWLWRHVAKLRAVELGIDRETHPYLSCLLEAFFEAAVPEEAAKLFFLLVVGMWPQLLRGRADGIALGAILGVGQAASELWSELPQDTLTLLRQNPIAETLAISNKLLILTGLGVIMGDFVGRARADTSVRRFLLFAAFFVPMLLHGLYDWGGLAGELAQPYFDTEEVPPWQVIVLYPFGYLIMLLVILSYAVWITRWAKPPAVHKSTETYQGTQS